MTISARVSGTWRETDILTRVSGTWRQVQEGWVRVSGTWRQFYQFLTVTISPSPVTTIQPPGFMESQGVVGNVTGGQAPFSYSWTRVSGSAEITATAPTTPFTVFQATTGVNISAVFRFTVTDANSQTASDDVTVNFVVSV